MVKKGSLAICKEQMGLEIAGAPEGTITINKLQYVTYLKAISDKDELGH